MAIPAATDEQQAMAARQKRMMILLAALLTVAALAGVLDSSLRAMTTADLPPVLAEVEAGPWAGWWLDATWSVDPNGDLVGDSSAVPGYPVDDFALRYAFPPPTAPQQDYRASFDITLTQGTLYLGVRADWHPSASEPPVGDQGDCDSVVFPLHYPLMGMAAHRRACRLAGLLDEAAGLVRPYSAALRADRAQAVSVIVQGGRAQFITLETVIYDVTTDLERGGLYLALGPQTLVRIANLTLVEGSG